MSAPSWATMQPGRNLSSQFLAGAWQISVCSAFEIGRMASNLTDDDIREFREIFNLVDTDGGGSISTDELGKLMETLGIPTTQEELQLMVSEIDDNGDGEIDFDEFVKVMSRKVNADYTPDEVRRAFKVFSGDAPEGQIRVADLEKALITYGHEKLSEDEGRTLVSQLDSADGMFNYTDYIQMMMLSSK
ncbi:unnamed protein product [Vitrella brassicaformis CCMP3155]|uniref:Calmodulin n=1 Tax=Vitrella brassicaformis (strain CCMP3155) TaxID=1169540 RepID=A0A0G4ERA8_VITBC|nr:unnamed protein product [Vitrella brassicaformis CCMP3155]|eukprot:CEL99811.1 unnamed protein product [Vitrella brassicaformis CCMP3155]